MAKLMTENYRKGCGPAVDIREEDGYAFLNVPHFRSFFYVYSYAYGLLISKAMFARYKKDPSFIEKVKGFLSAGSSKSPYDIFKSMGIDTSDPRFFEDGIRQIRETLDEGIALAKKTGLMRRI